MNTEKNNSEDFYFNDDHRLNLLSDGILRTEDGHVFHVHKFILAKSSKYFYAMFCGMGADKNDMTIPGIRGETLNAILSHIYAGKVHLTEDNLCEIMVASDYLLMDDLLPLVKTYVRRNMSVENCLCIFMTSLAINRNDILSDCYRFVQTHFESVVFSDSAELEELPLEALKLFLCDRNLRIQNERTAHFAILKWIEADVVSRLCFVPDLITHMAIYDVDEDLATEILQHHTVSNNPFCQSIADIKSTFEDESCLEVIQRYLHDRCSGCFGPRLPFKLHCIARFTATDRSDLVEMYITYDENIDLWRKLFETDLNSGLLLCAAGDIYMIRTDERNFRYSIVDEEVRELSSFVISRNNYVAVACECHVYVLGGASAITEEEIYDVEMYDEDHDTWVYCEPMFPVSNFAVAALNQRIYVLGYTMAFDNYDMVAQVYEASSDTWTLLPPASVIRSSFALVAYLENIYVIGGMVQDKYLKDVEIFDPLKNEWRTGTSLPYIYYEIKAFVLQDILIVCDNHWKDRSYMKSNPPVYWDVQRQCWERFDESSPMKDLHLYHFLSVDNVESIREITKGNRHPDTRFEKTPFGERECFSL